MDSKGIVVTIPRTVGESHLLRQKIVLNLIGNHENDSSMYRVIPRS